MSGRSYLSIGDVLSLLREEFPDVTISKIRFLESQGLVNPERSPSGYRKFYDTDVERLRWVLRQQREHFLPLKVIRDRLSADGADVREPEEGAAESDSAEVALRAVPDHNGQATPDEASNVISMVREPEPAMASAPLRTVSAHTPPSLGPRHDGDSDSAFPELAFPASLVKAPTTSSAVPPQSPPTPPPGPSPAVRTPAPEKPHEPPSVAPSARSGSSVPPTPPGGTSPPKPAPPVIAPPAAGPSAPSLPKGTTTGSSAKGASGDREAKFPVSSGVSGASLSVEELCAATGLQPSDIATLEGFNLIEPKEVAGISYYDEEALTVAKLASEFAKYGIEPRHLRLYRNAVDREVGLIEQIITPLLRQRNPEARQRAVDSSVELAKLGQGLRASLLRKELRHQLGG